MGKIEKVVVLSVLFVIVAVLGASLYDGPDEVVAEVDPEAGRRQLEPSDAGYRAGALVRDEPAVPLSGIGELERERSGGRAAARQINSAPRGERGGAQDAGREGAARRAEFDVGDPRSQEFPQPGSEDASNDDPRLGAGLLSGTLRQPEASSDGELLEPLTPSAREPRMSATPVVHEPAAEWDLISLEGLAETLDPSFKVYTCGTSETFASVATMLYGDAGKAGLLRRYNEGIKDLGSGQNLLVPVIDDRPVASGDYEVVEGDSLWKIAKKEYGAGHRWGEIYDANRDQLSSPDAVRPGMQLVIP